ncbi:MAG: nucleotidyl transferase AbiEii/AbiGii toxin family protein [Deltaproteobacteria bacterium]|nr:nucleotidyl transferase AbiEii/AbiGii toxin family protein [Deltaproteobacteria bacterium]
MTQSNSDFCLFHEDRPLFREAVLFTARESNFGTTLVEKDYYCSLLLSHLCKDAATSLVFKGGTCLSKVYADFYRLSEDLDFVISMKSDAIRSVRSKAAKPLCHLVDSIPETFPEMRIEDPLS